MKTFFFTTLAVSILPFFLASDVFAQSTLPCGNIIAPSNWNTSSNPNSSIQTNAINDCTHPFAARPLSSSTYRFLLEGNVVTHGSVIPVAGGTTSQYQIDVKNQRVVTAMFKHEGNDYRFMDIQEIPMNEADYRLMASEFFPAGTDIEPYIAAYLSSDPYSYFDRNDERRSILFNFDEFIYINWIPKRPQLESATYTVVYTEQQSIQQGSTWMKKLALWILPKAQAFTGTDIFAITFTLTNTTPEPIGASSVLFLPGIQASRLYKDGIAGTEDEVWVPDGNQDVRQLAMDSSGTSQNSIYTRNILENLPLGGTVYDSFARSMVNLVADQVIHAWTPFAYDWRYGVSDIASNGTKYQNEIRDAIDEIEYLAENSFSDKVTIIGHSNGGLLAKAIMKRLEQEGKAHLVDRVVLLASPQLGTPKAVGTILHGYDQEKLGGWAIDDVVARDVIQNMPGAYGLVTSQNYFTNTTDPVIQFENSTATQAFRNVYGSTIDTEAELRQFMIGNSDNRSQATTIDEVLRVNESMLNSEMDLHKNTLGTWVATTGVEVIEIIGTGLDTVSGFEYRTFQERVCSIIGVFSCENKSFYKPVPIISKRGDKTVIDVSASGYDGVKQKYYIDLNAVEDGGGNEEHYNISENPSIQKLIKNLLLATTSDIEFISTSLPNISGDRVLLGVHSPAEIEVDDGGGKRVGKITQNGVVGKEEEITGSSYFEIGSSKYIIVPNSGNYNIKLKGTAEGGATFSLDKLLGNSQIPNVSVRVATITASTGINIKYVNNALSNLEIDTNGDGLIDTVLTPQGLDITPKITYKTLRDKINSLSLSAVRKLPLLVLVEAAEILDKKSVTNPKLVPAETYTLQQLEVLLTTYQKKKWISQSSLEELKIIIAKLK